MDQIINWMEMIESGKVAAIAKRAKQLAIDKNCVTRDIRLISLAPDLQKLAAEGREPETLSLARLREPFQDDWEEQPTPIFSGLENGKCHRNKRL